jgi:hypothetical protein
LSDPGPSVIPEVQIVLDTLRRLGGHATGHQIMAAAGFTISTERVNQAVADLVACGLAKIDEGKPLLHQFTFSRVTLL